MPAEKKMSSDASQRDVVRAVVAFSLCSASLLLINKMMLKHLPMPSFVSSLQFVVSAVFVYGLKATRSAEVDDFEWRLLKPYSLYVLMFVATIYCNMKALEHSNVETIIVFRACCPLFVCVLDWAFLGRQLPSMRSMASLIVLLLGACGYVLSDRAFKLNGWAAYSWATAYLLIISVEMAYGKHIVGPHLSFASMWGPTLYTNTSARRRRRRPPPPPPTAAAAVRRRAPPCRDGALHARSPPLTPRAHGRAPQSRRRRCSRSPWRRASTPNWRGRSSPSAPSACSRSRVPSASPSHTWAGGRCALP